MPSMPLACVETPSQSTNSEGSSNLVLSAQASGCCLQGQQPWWTSTPPTADLGNKQPGNDEPLSSFTSLIGIKKRTASKRRGQAERTARVHGRRDSSTSIQAMSSSAQSTNDRQGTKGHGVVTRRIARHRPLCQHQADDAEQQAQLLVMIEQRKQQAMAIRLQNKCSFHLDWQQQQEIDHRVLHMVHRSPSPSVPLPASCSQVSFSELPHASLWDAAWVSRVCALSAQDLLVLHRQWLRQSMLLLAAGEQGGPGCWAYEQLVSLHSRHTSLMQSVLSLMPETWLQMSGYDMETLQPIAAPEPSWLASVFKAAFPKSVTQAAVSISRDYHAQTQQLHVEFCILLRQHHTLAGAMTGLMGMHATTNPRTLPFGCRKLQEAGSSLPALERLPHRGSSSSMIAGEDDIINGLSSVTQLIKANTGKQLALLKQFLCKMQISRPPIEDVKFAVMIHPVALNALSLMRGLVPGAETNNR